MTGFWNPTRHGVAVLGITSATGTPEVHVGTAVLTPGQAAALARRIGQVVAQQRAHGPWSLLRALVWSRTVDLVADVRYGLRCVAADGLRRRGSAR